MADWQSIVDRYGRLVWATAYRLLNDHTDADDCTQDVFLTALALSRRQRVRSWPALLTRLATHRALDRMRCRFRQANRHDACTDWSALAGPAPNPAERVEAVDLADRLRRALARLPAQQAEVFSLRFINELSYRDIARELDVKTTQVGVLLHRARRRLRELLAPSQVPDDTKVSP